MAASDAKPVAKKNVAHREYFRLRKNDNTLLEEAWTGVASTFALDGGAEGATDATVQQIGTTSRGYIDLLAAEMNADAVGLKISVTNANAVTLCIEINPEETGDIRTAVDQWNGVPLGTTNPLPNAAPNAPNGLLISTAGSLNADQLAAYVLNLHRALVPLPEVIVSSAAGAVLTLASDPGEDFTSGYAIVYDASNGRSAQVLETVSKVGTTLTLDNAPAITIEDGVDSVIVVPLPTSPLESADFAPSSLNGKGDWNTVAPDNAGITANGNAIATRASQASVDALSEVLIPFPEVIISSAAGAVLTLASDPGEDFTDGFAIVFDASNGRSAQVLGTVGKTGTALTLKATPAITIEDGVDSVLVLPTPTSPFETSDFAAGFLTDSLIASGAITPAKVSAALPADMTAISGVAAAAARLALSAQQMIPGTVEDTTTSPTTTVFAASDITEATANHFKNRAVLFTSGALSGQMTRIDAYALVSGEGQFTVLPALTEAPADTDTFLII